MSAPTSLPITDSTNGPARAVLYLRVSSAGQVKTDYDPEGISIPAQREACQRRAAQMGVEIVDEYIEPGRSAKELEHRPRFQELRQCVKDRRDVDYVIVYMFSRAFRNAADTALVKREFKKLGARFVASNMSLDDSDEAEMVEGILSYVDEYEIKRNGRDIRYKMGQKAKNGGTLGQAKLGYLNIHDKLEDGREVRAIAVDPERGHFMTLAFELFATGDYTQQELQATLTDRGLRTRPSGRHPGGPISDAKLSKLLRDRYYLGYVTYQGVEYKGRHKPLVTPEVFDKVQQLLDARGAATERQRKHHHYLKGSLWCGRCHDQGRESRMIVARAKGNGGTYFYFFCRGRQEHTCTEPYWDMDVVEEAVLRHYATVRLDREFAQQVRVVLYETIADRDQATKLLHKQLTTQLGKLDVQEENLLDLAADGDLPQAKIRRRLHRIQGQRQTLTEQLQDVGTNLDAGAALLEAALDLLEHPQELYRQITDHGRRMLNQALFDKLYIEGGEVTAHTPPPTLPSPPRRPTRHRHLAGRPTSSTTRTRRPAHPGTQTGRQRTGGLGIDLEYRGGPTRRRRLGRRFE